MRLMLIILSITVFGTAALAYAFRLEVHDQAQKAERLNRQVERLLEEIEGNARQRLADQNRIDQLNTELARSQARIEILDQQLVVAREQVDPDSEQMENRLRDRLESEYQQRLARATAEVAEPSPTVVSVIAQLAGLNSQERMALFNVQARFGGFLDSLDTDLEHKDRIAKALVDISLSQAQAREDLMSQGLEPQEIARQLRDIMDPGAVRETLAYDLTDEELAAFDQFQQQQPTTLTAGTVGAGWRLHDSRARRQRRPGPTTGY